MSGYAILRAKKLKTIGSVSRSARHTFREQPTPNADPTKVALNRSIGAKGSENVVNALEERLPAKRRKDAVLAIEYLITASPEAFRRHGGALDDLGDGYFTDALRWLQQKHGKENVVSATIHLDETTPHLVAYVVPMTKDGRLSCREYLGSPEKLRAMQTDFHSRVGAKRGLERGVEGSKAKHEDVKSFYSSLTAAGEAPKLAPRDYAAAAVGVRTKAWADAERLTKDNALVANRARRSRKSTRARARAVEKQVGDLDVRSLRIRQAEQVIESRSRALDKRESELSREAHRIMAIEAERDALARRLDIKKQAERPEIEPFKDRNSYENDYSLG